MAPGLRSFLAGPEGSRLLFPSSMLEPLGSQDGGGLGEACCFLVSKAVETDALVFAVDQPTASVSQHLTRAKDRQAACP